MKLLEVVPKNNDLGKSILSLCHQYLSENNLIKKNHRGTTEDWLNRKIDELDLKFHYFITLSFYKGTKSIQG